MQDEVGPQRQGKGAPTRTDLWRADAHGQEEVDAVGQGAEEAVHAHLLRDRA